MSLRKSPTLTPALLEACRRNARKSRGPRTPEGKANVRFNALKHKGRSEIFRWFYEAVHYAPPGQMGMTARALLTPDMARLDAFRNLAQVATECELPEKERLKLYLSKIRSAARRRTIFLRTIQESY